MAGIDFRVLANDVRQFAAAVDNLKKLLEKQGIAAGGPAAPAAATAAQPQALTSDVGLPAATSTPATIAAPNASVPASSVPKDEPKSVSFSEPPKDVEKVIEVAGSGMGASQPYKMYESEALAVYSAMQENAAGGIPGIDGIGGIGGIVTPDQLAQTLKSKYGMDAEVSNADGHPAVINKATGHVVAVDTNGNGMLETTDLDFASALKGAGASLPQPGADPLGQAAGVVQNALQVANLGVAA